MKSIIIFCVFEVAWVFSFVKMVRWTDRNRLMPDQISDDKRLLWFGANAVAGLIPIAVIQPNFHVSSLFFMLNAFIAYVSTTVCWWLYGKNKLPFIVGKAASVLLFWLAACGFKWVKPLGLPVLAACILSTLYEGKMLAATLAIEGALVAFFLLPWIFWVALVIVAGVFLYVAITTFNEGRLVRTCLCVVSILVIVFSLVHLIP